MALHQRRRWMTGLLVAGLVATACGGGDDTGSEGASTSDTSESTADSSASESDTGSGTESSAGGEVTTDIGIDDTTIKIGLLADLTGIFAPLVTDIVSAQEVYWDKVNEEGGIAGRQIELVVEDTAYDITQTQEKYEKLRDEVIAFSQSTGSPHTASLVPLMEEDNTFAIPLTWYSGWADPEIGKNVLEQGTNYCIEAMNVVEWFSNKAEEENGAKPKIAIISFPGEYGQDGATGAKIAAEALGLEIVYDGEAQVVPGQDQTAVITEIVNSGADWVFATINPTTLGEIMGGAVAQGFTGNWTGSVPSYDFRLLDSALGEAIDKFYYQSAYNVAFGTDVPGMATLVESMKAATPDARVSDAAVIGWVESIIMETVLRAAAESGDMTREGVLNAALSVPEINMEGLGPDQTYSGEPNDYVVRESAIFKPSLEFYTEGGGSGATYANDGNTGSELVQDFAVSDTAANYDYQGACFTG